MKAATSSGAQPTGVTLWPTPGAIKCRARGIVARASSAHRGGTTGSRSPERRSTGPSKRTGAFASGGRDARGHGRARGPPKRDFRRADSRSTRRVVDLVIANPRQIFGAEHGAGHTQAHRLHRPAGDRLTERERTDRSRRYRLVRSPAAPRLPASRHRGSHAAQRQTRRA